MLSCAVYLGKHSLYLVYMDAAVVLVVVVGPPERENVGRVCVVPVPPVIQV